MAEYRKQQLWELYEKLPEELKKAVFSLEITDDIYNVGQQNNIEDKKIAEIVRYTGWVLLGLLPPDEFQETLEKEVKLKPAIAKKIVSEINRFAFRPVKESLSALYRMEIAPSAETAKEPEPKKPITPTKKTPSKDVYREPVE